MKIVPVSIVLALCGALAGCGAFGGGAAATKVPGPQAVARLESRSGSSVSGEARFVQAGEGVQLTVDVAGLTPNAEQGFHVHDKGDCSAPDAASAGGHFNPTGKPHGGQDGAEHHAGDMPNLKADAQGAAHATVTLPGLQVAVGPTGVVGRAVVIHQNADDYRSQPAGNSGPRVACGVIVPAGS